MNTPSRNLILENIYDTLRGIDGSGDYKTVVDTVERSVKDWDSVGKGSMPWLGFKPERSRHVPQFSGHYRVEMPIAIVGHVNEASAGDRSDELSDLVDDVTHALGIDTQRGGNAIYTQIQELETDEGDPDTIDSKGGTGSFVMRILVVYFRTTEAT